MGGGVAIVHRTRAIVMRAGSASNLASSICSTVTGLLPTPLSDPRSLKTQLLKLALGMPSTSAVTAAACPALTTDAWRHASYPAAQTGFHLDTVLADNPLASGPISTFKASLISPREIPSRCHPGSAASSDPVFLIDGGIRADRKVTGFPVRELTFGIGTVTGPMPVWIARSG